MTPKQAATALGCSVRHVRALISRGRLKATVIGDPDQPGAWRYEIDRRSVARYKVTPQRGGWPRGRRRA